MRLKIIAVLFGLFLALPRLVAQDIGAVAITSALQRPQLVLQSGHIRAISSVAITNDGRWLASSAEGDRNVRLWDRESGREVRTFDTDASTSTVAFSPDGAWIAAGTPAEVKIWDVNTGVEVFKLQASSSPEPVFSVKVVFSSDGTQLVTGDEVGIIRLWDVRTRAMLKSLRVPVPFGLVDSLAISADMTLIAAGFAEGTVWIWEPGVGRDEPIVRGQNTSAASGVAFSSDGRLLAWTAGKEVHVWNITTGQIERRAEVDQRWVKAVAFSPTGQLACGGGEGILRYENPTNGRLFTEVDFGGHPYHTVESIAFSHDGRWIVAGDSNGEIHLVDVESAAVKQRFIPQLQAVDGVAINTQRSMLALSTSERARSVRIFDMISGQEMYDFRDSMAPFTFSDDGRWLSSSDGEGHIRLWDFSRDPPAAVTLPGHSGRTASVAFSPNGAWVVAGGASSFHVWDLHRPMSEPVSLDQVDVRRLLFAQDSSQLMAADGGGNLVRWNVRTWDINRRTSLHSGRITALALSADGLMLASMGDDKTILVEDALTGQTKFRVRTRGPFGSPALAFSPDGAFLAAGDGDRILLVDLSNGSIARSLTGHTRSVNAVTFTPNGAYLLSAGDDGAARLFDVASGVELAAVMVPVESDQEAKWLAVSPEGLFDGTPNALRGVMWRPPSSNEVVTLDSFFNDFFSPGLIGDLLANQRPTPRLSLGTVIKIPGLSALLSKRLAHLRFEPSPGVICFDSDPTALFPPIGSKRLDYYEDYVFDPDATDKDCQYYKPLPADVPREELSRMAEAPVKIETPWDNTVDRTVGRLHVFVAAIDRYDQCGDADRLPSSVASAEKIEELFAGTRTGPGRQSLTVRRWPSLIDCNATKDELLRSLETVGAEASVNDTVIIYLAGHGVINVREGGEVFYFLPASAKSSTEEGLRETGISVATLANTISHFTARRIVFLVDTCQSGGAVESIGKIADLRARIALRQSSRNGGQLAAETGVGIYVIAAATSLQAVLQTRDAALTPLVQTIADAADTVAPSLTAAALVAYVEQNLAPTALRLTKVVQNPTTESVGVDFQLLSR